MLSGCLLHLLQDFNPRSREGSDCVATSVLLTVMISIRAPAKGATCLSKLPFNQNYHFNPRSREGSDKIWYSKWYSKNYFNPRSREGSDVQNTSTQAIEVQFQSALPRRERRICCDVLSCFSYFNPRSREGSDSNIIQQFSFFCIILYILSVIT